LGGKNFIREHFLSSFLSLDCVAFQQMVPLYRLILFSFILNIFSVCSLAQNVSNKGKLFWTGHMGHIDGAGSNFALYITTDASSFAAVRVSVPGASFNQIVTVQPNTIRVVTVPSAQVYMGCSDCVLNQGIKIES